MDKEKNTMPQVSTIYEQIKWTNNNKQQKSKETKKSVK